MNNLKPLDITGVPSDRGTCSWANRPMTMNILGDRLQVDDKGYAVYTWTGAEWTGAVVTAQTNPLTGGIELTAGGRRVAIGLSAAAARGRDMKLMASAPTVTVGTTGSSSIASAREYRWDSGTLYFAGGLSALNATYGKPAWVTQENGVKRDGGPIMVSFVTDAPIFEIGMFDTTGMSIFVDDEVVSATETTGAGNLVVKVDFAGVRKARRIDLFINITYFRGVWVPPTSICWTPTIKTRGIFLGDSFAEGTGVTKAISKIAPQLKLKLGMDSVVASGAGGTGYYNVATNKRKLLDRLAADLYPNTYDLIVVAMGCNDWAAPDYATLYPVVLETLSAIKTNCPNSHIVVFTGWRPVNGVSADEYITQSVRDAAAVVGVPVFDTRAWLGGTGRIGATTGDGVSDWAVGTDGVHPADAGSEYLADRMVDCIASTLT